MALQSSLAGFTGSQLPFTLVRCKDVPSMVGNFEFYSWPVHRQDQLQSHIGKDKESTLFSFNLTFTEDRGKAKIVSAIILVQVKCSESSKEEQCSLCPGPRSFNIL